MNEGGVDGHGRVSRWTCICLVSEARQINTAILILILYFRFILVLKSFGIMYKHREVDRMRAMSSKGSGTRQQCSIGTARRQPIMECLVDSVR
jgi:hypothetical protein